MNLVQQFARLPWPLIAAFLAANLIPYLSALATTKRGWWTGAVTMGLSLVDGVLSVLAQSGVPVNWKTVIGTAFGAWAVAAVHHSKVLAGTPIETALHNVGSKTPYAPGHLAGQSH
jgi:hypothetical protein